MSHFSCAANAPDQRRRVAPTAVCEVIQRWYSRALSSTQGTVWTCPESNSAIRRSISARQASSAPPSASASNNSRADFGMRRSYPNGLLDRPDFRLRVDLVNKLVSVPPSLKRSIKAVKQLLEGFVVTPYECGKHLIIASPPPWIRKSMLPQRPARRCRLPSARGRFSVRFRAMSV